MSGNTLRGTVSNTGSVAVRGVALVQALRIARIGDLEPGQSRQVELELDGRASGVNDSLSMVLLADEWDFNQPRQAPAEIKTKQSVLDALYSMQAGRDRQPAVLGWLDRPPLELSIDKGRVLPQQTALVKLPVRVGYAAGATVDVPRDWLAADTRVTQANGRADQCSSQAGVGWWLDDGMLASTLQLPPDLRALAVDQATLYAQAEGPIPAAMTVEVLDRTTGEWIAQNVAGTTVELDQPRRFFDQDGRLTLRVVLDPALRAAGVCVTTGASVRGTLP
jgi:hypothetical protein